MTTNQQAEATLDAANQAALNTFVATMKAAKGDIESIHAIAQAKYQAERVKAFRAYQATMAKEVA